jgi:hypothetical protein
MFFCFQQSVSILSLLVLNFLFVFHLPSFSPLHLFQPPCCRRMVAKHGKRISKEGQAFFLLLDMAHMPTLPPLANIDKHAPATHREEECRKRVGRHIATVKKGWYSFLHLFCMVG